MDFRHLIVTCLFSMLRLSFETQKIKENYAILKEKGIAFLGVRRAFLRKRAKKGQKGIVCFLVKGGR